jgi:hypothetical protein
MGKKSYFTLQEWLIIVLLAVAGALINSYLPIKSITQHLGIPGPAAGMALFGGIIFVLWVSLAHQFTRKKYSGIITSVLIATFCLFIRPWYGVVEPAWFSVYGIVGLICLGIIIELTASKALWLRTIGGGLGNLACLVITWMAIGFHTSTWVPASFAPLLIFGAIVSGSIGIWLARGASYMLRSKP